MKRVLLYTLEYPPDQGGVASYLYALHHALPAVTVIRATLGRYSPRWLGLVFDLIQRVRRDRIQCVAVSHVLPVGYAALVTRVIQRIPYVVFVHGLDLLRARRDPWKKMWCGIVLRHARTVIANSRFTEKVAESYGVPREKLVVLTPCLEALPVLASEEGRTGHTLLSVGRLVKRKNHATVIAVFPELIKRFPGLTYTIVGNGPERHELEEQIAKLKVRAHITIKDHVSDAERAALYEACDVFVLPVLSSGDDVEGFGIVFLEAASFAKPVVAGRGGGAEEAVEDMKTGILIDPMRQEELVAAISTLLENPTYSRELGARARARVEREFLCTSRAQALLKIYS
ncbi:glycosyltransferase family 4 protein [Candidatus Uhrbacteria bacterium]|nr:glycosyltransferase family 4 protein [Candidatus Uhrbacteria bacterium]